ncbi:MAG: hypothetical protein Q9M92_01985 [Enterobacterales bacterium]|nr:hypothetical protein [Enterobacterales bacterium]
MNKYRTLIFFLCSILIFGCTSNTLFVDVEEESLTTQVDEEVQVRVRIFSEKKLSLKIYKDLSESLRLYSVYTTCEKEIRGEEPHKLKSRLVDINVSNTKFHTFKLNGYVSKDQINSRYIIDFGKVGKLCGEANSNKIKFAVGVVPEPSILQTVKLGSNLNMTKQIQVEIIEQ